MRKTRTSDLISISIFELRKRGYLSANSVMQMVWNDVNGEHAMLLEIRTSNTHSRIIVSGADLVGQSFDLVTTDCFFGGSRWWFECDCARRVAILYKHGSYLACRKCLDLAYPLQQFTHTGKWNGFYRKLQSLNWLIKGVELRTKFWKGSLTKRQRKRYEKITKHPSHSDETIL